MQCPYVRLIIGKGKLSSEAWLHMSSLCSLNHQFSVNSFTMLFFYWKQWVKFHAIVLKLGLYYPSSVHFQEQNRLKTMHYMCDVNKIVWSAMLWFSPCCITFTTSQTGIWTLNFCRSYIKITNVLYTCNGCNCNLQQWPFHIWLNQCYCGIWFRSNVFNWFHI